ncbi:MAG: TetR/AcrR family transcriptional regulator [Proteobacteria bacterium]|nr:TetR/AcrR family transcriptional regulator [Pseudomonadota bacterium]
MNSAPAAAQIKRGRKFDQVVQGARAVFMRDGFERANVDDIAAEAGVSKATLYSYFSDKRMLFVEVARQESQKQADEAEALIDLCAHPECVLPIAAHRIIDFFSSEFGRAVFRICITDIQGFPDLGQQFYASGPAIIRDRLAAYLTGAVSRSEVVIEDVNLAAEQFMALCKSDILSAVYLGTQHDVSEARRNRIADGAVAMFMARYGVKDHGH